jgi:Glycine/D-amino acid oxidases (deaminating)
MKVLVLGAGVIGTATAWYLVESGHEVTVVDRRDAAGMETSFANGAQISVSHAEPWANPEAPLKILQWLWRDDSPLLFRLRMDPRQWTWGARFLYECQPGRTRENIRNIVKLSIYSRDALQALRNETGIQYDQLERGILHYFTDRSAYESAVRSVELVRSYGLDRDIKTVDEAIAIEPALAPARDRLFGATYTATDESGDAHKFTQALAKMAQARGAKFLYGHRVQKLVVESDGVRGIDTGNGILKADSVVVALGSYSPLLTRPVGIELPVYPAKGYSATVDIVDPA